MPALTRQQEAELRLQEGIDHHQTLSKVRTNYHARRHHERTSGSTLFMSASNANIVKKPFRRRELLSSSLPLTNKNMISKIDPSSEVAKTTFEQHFNSTIARLNEQSSQSFQRHGRRKTLPGSFLLLSKKCHSVDQPSSSLLSISFTIAIVTLMNLMVLQPSQMVGLVVATSIQGSLAATSQQQQQTSNSVIQMPPTMITASSGQAASSTMISSQGKARYKTMYACEDRQLTMDCDYGSKINLIRANFGRFSITQCNEQGQLDLSTDCMSPITFRIMQERCQDKQKCSVNATSKLFGDRCPKTRKYLEVHFQCQPDPRVLPGSGFVGLDSDNLPFDRVDLRNASQIAQFANPPATQSVVVPQTQPTASYSSSQHVSAGSSSVLPPNNNNNPFFQQQQHQYPPIPQNFQAADDSGKWVNSDIMSYHDASNSETALSKLQDPNSTREPFIVTMRHSHIVNMSNPRCNLWDPTARLWTERGTQIIQTNQTHTICAFDQATSYLLVMDRMTSSQQLSSTTIPSQSSASTISEINQQALHHRYQQQQNPIVTQDAVPSFGPAIPDILDNQPVVLVQQAPNRQQQQSTSSGNNNNSIKFFTLLGYLLAALFVAVLFMTIAFVASSLRNSSSSAGAAFKSLGNFAALSGGSASKCKHRRQDMMPGGGGGPGSSLHSSNKDLLVINNSNGHQFLYAPASTTKISSSSSTHILSATLGGRSTNGQPTHHQGTLHRVQQQMYSGNGATLSSLSATGTQGNNYYYGLMGLNPIFQQQQQPQLLSQQHHVNQQQQQLVSQSYSHQANKSTISTESANSSSSSGVESGSTSMQQQQQQQQQQTQTQQACLVTTSSAAGNDFNLMSNQLANYGQTAHPQGFFAAPIGATTTTTNSFHHQHQRPQPTLTLNAHYSTSGIAQPLNMTAAQNQHQLLHQRQMSSQMRDHIYETVEYEKPYMSRLLILGNNANDL